MSAKRAYCIAQTCSQDRYKNEGDEIFSRSITVVQHPGWPRIGAYSSIDHAVLKPKSNIYGVIYQSEKWRKILENQRNYRDVWITMLRKNLTENALSKENSRSKHENQ